MCKLLRFIISQIVITESKLYKLETSYLLEQSKYGDLMTGYNLDAFLEESGDLSLVLNGASLANKTATDEHPAAAEQLDGKSPGRGRKPVESLRRSAAPSSKSNGDSSRKKSPLQERRKHRKIIDSERLFSGSSLTCVESLAAAEALSLHSSQQVSMNSSRSTSPPLAGGRRKRSVAASLQSEDIPLPIPPKRNPTASPRLDTLRRSSSTQPFDVKSSTESLVDTSLKPLPVTARKRGRH
jgi:hypothetical protein